MTGRRAFTLLELVLSLALTGLLALVARTLLDALGHVAVRADVQATRTASATNAAEALRVVLAQVRLPDSARQAFSGSADLAEFRSWCDSPSGRPERCTVRLDLGTSQPAALRIRMRLRAGRTDILLTDLGAPTVLLYQERGHTQAVWTRSWTRGSTLPSALGVLVGVDTLVFPVGPIS